MNIDILLGVLFGVAVGAVLSRVLEAISKSDHRRFSLRDLLLSMTAATLLLGMIAAIMQR